MTIVDLIRHGETERPDVLAGRTDLALSEAGWRQFERQTANGGWDAIVSSPLKRAREAAERLSSPTASRRALMLAINSRAAAKRSPNARGVYHGALMRSLPQARRNAPPRAPPYFDGRLYLRGPEPSVRRQRRNGALGLQSATI